MKIESVKISNILSFEEAGSLDAADPIIFEGNNGYLIGANGSGKSNFVEILFHILSRVLFTPFRVNTDLIDSQKKNQAIKAERIQSGFKFITHRSSDSAIMQVEISLKLSPSDHQNLQLLFERKELINQLLQTYSTESMSWIEINKKHMTKTLNTTSVKLSFIDHGRDDIGFQINEDASNPDELFIFRYLRYFELYNQIFWIANKYHGTNWQPLNSSIDFIGSFRNYASIERGFSLAAQKTDSDNDLRNRQKNQSTKIIDTNEPASLQRFKQIVSYKLNELVDERGIEYALKQIHKDDFFSSVNKRLSEDLGLEVKVEKQQFQSTFFFDFYDHSAHKKITIEELSAGQRSIIHLIATIYSNATKDGVIIIDEPEIHLHPTIQVKYQEIIESVSKKTGIQFIVITHSPFFINHSIAPSIFRFYKENNATKVVRPSALTPDQGALFKTLKYTNSAKIFFSDAVVLVEGDTDEYFFRSVYDEYGQKLFGANTRSIDFISIEGKGNLKKWQEFLENFRIKNFYIGDWDNIVEMKLMPSKEFTKHKEATAKRLKIPADKIDNVKKKEIIKYLRKDNNKILKALDPKIDALYADGIYLLKEGETEDYLPIEGKRLGTVIDYCNNKLSHWIKSKAKKQSEIKNIIRSIINSI